MIFIGIDPGLNGGIAFLSDKNTIIKGEFFGIDLRKTPVIGGKEYDIQAMKNLLIEGLKSKTIGVALIENQISLPGQGLTSTLQTGKGFGIWLGLLAGLNIPYQIVGARQWQGKLFTGVSSKLETKEKSEVIAKRLFPYTDFRKSDRATKADDGLTDAACIAEYARRTYTGEHEPESGVPHTVVSLNPNICIICGKYFTEGEENNCIKIV